MKKLSLSPVLVALLVVGCSGKAWTRGAAGLPDATAAIDGGTAGLAADAARAADVSPSASGGEAGVDAGGASSACDAEWCWSNPPRQVEPYVASVSGTADDDVWAVGAQVSHWDGHAWQLQTPSINTTWFFVWAAARDDVWLGGDGKVAHFDGQHWQDVTPASPAGHCHPGGTGPNDVWVVCGGVAHWNGAAWRFHQVPSSSELVGLAVVAHDDVWVGNRSGAFFHWNGLDWQGVDTGASPPSLMSMWASGQDVWATLYVSPILSVLLHHEGDRWAELHRWVSTPVGLSSVFGSADDLWVAHDGVEHWDGRSWSDVALTGHAGWVAPGGHAYVGGFGGSLGRSDRTTVEHFSPRFDLESLEGIWGLGGGEVLAAGEEFGRHGREGWIAMPTPLPGAAVRVMWGSAADDVWAVGDQLSLSRYDPRFELGFWALHWNGVSWARVDYPLGDTHALGGRARDDVWAFGPENVAAHFDGQTWHPVELPPLRVPIDVAWVAPNGEVWAVNEDVVLRRGLDGVWSTPAGAPAGAIAVWGTAADDVWIAAGDGAFQYDGAHWTSHPVPYGYSAFVPTAMVGTADDDVWMAGRAGLFLHWTGTSWRLVDTGTTKDIVNLWMGPDGEGWASVEEGGILARAPRR